MGARIQINKGDQYGRLTILEEVEPRIQPNGDICRMVKCLCICGNQNITRLAGLRSGHTKSCGCYNNEIRKIIQPQNCLKHGDRTKKSKHHYLYTTWCCIKQRCLNPNHPKYKDYSKRGIYEPWINSYQLFKEYILTNLGERPKGYSLDRIKNDIGYFPDNLRWADDITQANNK